MHTLKYIYRTFRRNELLSVLIVLSLAVGLVSFYYVMSYVRFEMSFDGSADNLYRLNQVSTRDGSEISRTARTSPAIGSFMEQNLPEITGFSRLVLLGEVIFRAPSGAIREKETLLADTAHFSQFNYRWKEGNAAKMQEPFQIAISSELAENLFGDDDAMGRTVEINSPNFEGTFPFTVAGVFENRPENTHMKPSLLISYATLYKFIGNDIDQSWNWNNLFTYVTINNRIDLQDLNEKANKLLGESVPDFSAEQGIQRQVVFQKAGDIHTNPGYTGEFSKGVDMEQLAYLGILAVFILLMTYLNFVNLFVVRTLGNARQMGIRSLLGSSGGSLLRMHLWDIFILNMIAFVLAITLIQVLDPYVVKYFEINPAALTGIYSGNYFLVGFLASVLISALIPVLRFSRVNWSGMLTRRNHTGSSSDLRWYGGILGTQFFIAVFFLSGLVVVYHQLWQIRNHDPGIDVHGKWVIKAPYLGMNTKIENHDQLLWSEMQSVPGVTALVAMNEIPGNELYWRNDGVGKEAGNPVPSTFAWLGIGQGYFRMFRINVISGRTFDDTKDTYNTSVILNETGARDLGFDPPADASGQNIYLGETPVRVVGVVSDFNQESVKKIIEPQFFRFASSNLNYFVLSIDGTPQYEILGESYNKVFPGAPYEMFSLEEHYNRQYVSEMQLSQLILFLSVVAMLITFVGVVGLSIQVLRKRAKELIIRKVHGATNMQLWTQIAGIFCRIALVAYISSIPVAYFVFSSWTERFTVGSFPLAEFIIIPAVLLSLLVIISITFQVLRLAGSNPGNILVAE